MWGRRQAREPEPLMGECDQCGRSIAFETELSVTVYVDWGNDDGEAGVFCSQRHALEHLSAQPFVRPESTEPDRAVTWTLHDRVGSALDMLGFLPALALSCVGAYTILRWLWT